MRIRPTALALILLPSAACGAGTGDTTAPPPDVPASTAITQLIVTAQTRPNLNTGDTVRLLATAYDAQAVAHPATFSWQSSDPALARVDATGLATLLAGSVHGVDIRASVGTITASAHVPTGGWLLTETTDPINGSVSRLLEHGANTGTGLSSIPLSIRCVNGLYEVFVRTAITQSGAVRYRLSGQAERVETWNEAVSFNALFYPGNRHTFVSQLASADTLLFLYTEFQGPQHTAIIPLRGLAQMAPLVSTGCPTG